MKNKGIQQIFSEVPETYEKVNHVLTLGFDILWRHRAAKAAAIIEGERWLDCCCGTGEMAVNLSRRASDNIQVFAADFSLPMLSKARLKTAAGRIRFLAADIKKLPLPDDSFDLVTISFATRNINIDRENLMASFKEFHRILKPGGCLINLETSQPESPLIRRLFHLYVRLTVKPVGCLISGSRSGYSYLAHTIPRFYNAQQLADIMVEAGFRNPQIKRLLFGVTAIHQAIK